MFYPVVQSRSVALKTWVHVSKSDIVSILFTQYSQNLAHYLILLAKFINSPHRVVQRHYRYFAAKVVVNRCGPKSKFSFRL